MTAESGPEVLRRRRRTRWTVTAVAGLAVAGIGATAVLAGALADPAPPPSAGPQPATVKIRKTDLAETERASGDLGYGPEHALTGRKPGTVTWLPAVGDVVERGGKLYTVDAKPVPLLYGGLPFYRPISSDVDDGPDIKVLEQNLAELGFGGFGSPDEKFTWATERALKKWQKSLGLEQTGTLEPGDVVVRPGAIRVAEVPAEPGGEATGELLRVTGTERLVTAELELSKQDMAKPGTKVEVELPNRTRTGGEVVSAEPKAGSPGEQDGAPGGNQESEAKLEVVVSLSEPGAAKDFGAAPVSVTFTSGTAENVLAVPVGALLALREGGHAVEVVEGGTTRLVKVETGLFAGGQVEITGDGLAEGMTVVTTS